MQKQKKHTKPCESEFRETLCKESKEEAMRKKVDYIVKLIFEEYSRS